ncbi:hypothetical protein LTR08_006247 [Meristemomyces frigidus]|nr:hypothetical protein LTR08_006247 [Meristemomyces frigidus]
MASAVPRAAKRLRLTNTPGYVCTDCRRAFAASTQPRLQQQPPPQPPPSQHVGQTAKTTHFGFETVAEELKASKVRTVFSSVASSYDTMNDLMSLGIHRLWKDHFVRSLNPGIRPTPPPPRPPPPPPQSQRILDIAGGTGDIAFRLLDHATTTNRDPHTSVLISDINPQMLAEGRKRCLSTPYHATNRVSFLEANAEDLSAIESSSIDLYTVAFGIRNFTHKATALREAYRVLKPGGVFACLEFTPNLANPVLNALYKRWSFGAIPLIGQLVAGDRESYQYLVESIEKFPSQREFAAMVRETGFLVPGDAEGGGWEDLSMGIAAVHKGVKPV